MNYKLEFHSAIAKEYNEAYKWYEERSEGLGEKFIASVRQTMEKIGEHPLLFGKR
jgi:hypothetical protein